MVEMHYRKVAAYMVFAFAVLALLAFGVAGVGRGANPHFDDVRYFYAAAQTMLNGQSPYTFEAFKLTADAVGIGNGIGVYPYPPHSLLPSVPLTWFPIEVSRWLWTIANLCVLGVVALASLGILVAAVVHAAHHEHHHERADEQDGQQREVREYGHAECGEHQEDDDGSQDNLEMYRMVHGDLLAVGVRSSCAHGLRVASGLTTELPAGRYRFSPGQRARRSRRCRAHGGLYRGHRHA